MTELELDGGQLGDPVLLDIGMQLYHLNNKLRDHCNTNYSGTVSEYVQNRLADKLRTISHKIESIAYGELGSDPWNDDLGAY